MLWNLFKSFRFHISFALRNISHIRNLSSKNYHQIDLSMRSSQQCTPTIDESHFIRYIFRKKCCLNVPRIKVPSASVYGKLHPNQFIHTKHTNNRQFIAKLRIAGKREKKSISNNFQQMFVLFSVCMMLNVLSLSVWNGQSRT